MHKKRNWDLLKPVWLSLIVAGVFWLISLQDSMPMSERFFGAYLMGGIPMGWTFINQHKPQTMVLMGTWWFWLLWNFGKLVLSALIGSILVPYQLWKFYKS